jgi:hypothetical protein
LKNQDAVLYRTSHAKTHATVLDSKTGSFTPIGMIFNYLITKQLQLTVNFLPVAPGGPNVRPENERDGSFFHWLAKALQHVVFPAQSRPQAH